MKSISRVPRPLLFAFALQGSLLASLSATTFDFSDTNVSTSGNNSTSTGNVFATQGSPPNQSATIDGLLLTIDAVNSDTGATGTTVTLGANSQGWGVLSSGETGSAGAVRRVGGSIPVEAFEFSFDADVSLDSLRFGSLGTGEVIGLEFVSGTNPFTVGTGLTITYDGTQGPSFDVLLTSDPTVTGGIGTIQAGTVIRLFATTPTGGGFLFNEMTVSVVSTADVDGDFLLDLWEDEHFGDNALPTTPAELALQDGTGDALLDNDGATNEQEETAGTDPNNPDTDGDTLTDGAEIITHGTDPLLADTDGDGFNDDVELAAGSDPLLATSTPAPAITVFQSTPDILPPGGGAARLHWAIIGADSIVINDGTTDIGTFSTGADGQAFIDLGFLDVSPTVLTNYTITADSANAISNSVAPLILDVTAPGGSYADAVMADGPLAYFRFEEPSGSPVVFDWTNNGNDSTAFLGSVSTGASGAIGGGVALNTASITTGLTMDPDDPDGDNVDDGFGTIIDPDGKEGWSLEAIARPDVGITGGTQIVLSQQDGAGNGRSNQYLKQTGQLTSFQGGGTHPGTYLDGTPAADESWYHFLITAIGTATAGEFDLRFYVDGVLVAEDFAINANPADGSWIIGTHKNQGSNFFNGRLDEIAIYNKPLDDPNMDGDQADSTVAGHFAAFLTDPTVAPLLSFGPDQTITTGSSAELRYKVGITATTATIDQGLGALTPGTSGSATPSPTIDTLYTLTVDGSETLDALVTVLDPPVITAAGLTAPDGFGDQYFEVTAINLDPAVTYELYFTTDLPGASWTPTGIIAVGDGLNPVTFTDTLALDTATEPRTFYQIWTTP